MIRSSGTNTATPHKKLISQYQSLTEKAYGKSDGALNAMGRGPSYRGIEFVTINPETMNTQPLKRIGTGAAFFLAVLGIVSCEQVQDEPLTAEDVQEISATIQADNASQQESDVVGEFVNIGLEDQGQKAVPNRFRKIPAAAEMSWTNDANNDGTTGDYRLVIDFGTTGIACYDGRTRKGKIIATANGLYRNQGTTITTTTEGYAVSRDPQLLGFTEHQFSRTVVNNGTDADGNIVFSVTESNVATEPDGQVTNWNSERTRTWDWGTDGTRFSADDFYYVTGSGRTERVGIRTIDRVINQALTFKFDCGVVYGGLITHTDVESGNNIVVDYGNGCTVAKTVTYNINGRTITIIL